ncbi:hypothetical protein VIGAN_04062800, partial [Vigna angularis var. angularis]
KSLLSYSILSISFEFNMVHRMLQFFLHRDFGGEILDRVSNYICMFESFPGRDLIKFMVRYKRYLILLNQRTL